MSENFVVENSGRQILAEWKRSEENRMPAGPGLHLFNPAMSGPGFKNCLDDEGAVFLEMGVRSASSRLCLDGVTVVETRSQELPLQSHSFALVVLSHLVSDGAEPEFREACRLLQPGGVLLVMGLNRNGWRYLRDRPDNVPGLRPLAVRQQLEQLDLNTRAILAGGFLKTRWPENMNRGLARMLMPVADLVLVVARKYEPALGNPVKRSRLRTVGVPSAIAGP